MTSAARRKVTFEMPSLRQFCASAIAVSVAVVAIGAGRVEACPAPRSNQLHVTATDTGFEVAGRLTTGAATIRFTNGSHAPHALDLYRLSPGVTVEKLLTDVGDDDWSAFAADLADGGPGNGTPNIVSPGRTAVVVGDGLRAGAYALMDGTPGFNGVPNFAQGYATSIAVSDGPSGTEPASDGDVLITDTAVHLPRAITRGHGTFAVHYQGDHEFQLLRLRPGATVRQAFDYWIARFSGEDVPGPPPAEFVGGLADLRPGVHGWVTLDLPPGVYGVWSIEDGDFTDVENGVTATFVVRADSARDA